MCAYECTILVNHGKTIVKTVDFYTLMHRQVVVVNWSLQLLCVHVEARMLIACNEPQDKSPQTIFSL